jgi:anti-sigma-K factor RskA
LNIEEYISSGILEAYVLGELTEQERAAVEKNLLRYPELREELRLAEDMQELLLMKTAVSPRADVKNLLFERIEANVIQVAPDPKISFWKYAVAASVTLAFISSYLAYDYHGKWKHTENSLSELIAQNQRVATDYNVVNRRLDKIENDIKIINNPAFSRVIMKGTANAPESMAYVYWNASSSEVYLSLQHMKELSTENQYQLWAIIDGKPVDAGVFDDNLAGLVKMKDVGTGVAAFAVTIEPRGGKLTPSLETMQVLGNIVKG